MAAPHVIFVDGREYAPKPLSPHTTETFGGYLRKLRLDVGLTLKRVSTLTGVDAVWLEAVERTGAARLHFPELVALADLYNVSLDLLAAAFRNGDGQVPSRSPIRAADDLQPDAQPEVEDDECADEDGGSSAPEWG